MMNRVMNYQTINNEDFGQCRSFICLLIEMSELSRKEGLLALEDAYMQKIDFPLLHQGLNYVIDGTNTDLIKEILSNLTASSKYTGLDLLKGILTIKFIPLLQSGENPEIIKHILYSCLGFDMYKKYAAEEDIDQIPGYLSIDLPDNAYHEGTNLFEDVFAELDDGSIQVVLRNITNGDLVYALMGSSLPVKKRIVDNLSHTMANQIIHEIQHTEMQVEAILAAQKKMLDILQTKGKDN